jgi:hypothetical protein
MAALAIWFQETYTFSSRNAILLMVFIGLVAVSMAVQAIVQISISMKAAKTIKEIAATADELKERIVPLIETAMKVGQKSEELLQYTTPRMKVVSDNALKASDLLLETSGVVRASAQQFDLTIADANLRAQRQIARFDNIVTTTLNTTAEVIDTVTNGIRTPALRVAGFATQLRYGLGGVLAAVKSKTGSRLDNGNG